MDDNSKSLDPIVVRLRALRVESGTKQKDVADAIRVGHSVMSAYENGSCPTPLRVVREWATLFGRDLQLTGEGKAPAAMKSPARAPGLVSVELTRYQAALASGTVLAAVQQDQSDTSKELVEIAKLLVLALGR